MLCRHIVKCVPSPGKSGQVWKNDPKNEYVERLRSFMFTRTSSLKPEIGLTLEVWVFNWTSSLSSAALFIDIGAYCLTAISIQSNQKNLR